MGNPLHVTSMPAPQKSQDSTGPRFRFLGSIFLANIWLCGSIPGLVRSLEEGMATPSIFLPGEFHGQRSLDGYSPWGCTESDMTERLMLSLSQMSDRMVLQNTGLAER